MSVAAPTRDPVVVVDRDNPYPGLHAFTESDAGFFYGRNHEGAELFRLVKRRVLTVCFGASGLGKTSLLNAGLFPRLRQANFFPIPVRLDFAPDRGHLADQVKKTVSNEAARYQLEVPEAGDQETLWEYFHQAYVWDRRNQLQTPVLVFDQFEELFTLGERDARVEQFVQELADLIENRIPASELDRFVNAAEDPPFALDRQHYKVLLSLREDYLPHLEDLLPQIPSLDRNRFRLTAMNETEALKAILEPGREIMAKEVAERILSLACSRGAAEAGEDPARSLDQLRVEPAILSLFCREINDRRRRKGLKSITEDLLEGASEQIVTDFYERCLADKGPQVRTFVENRLVTGSGFRRAEALEEAIREPGVTKEDIEDLVNRRLLRTEERLEIPHVELIHDVLTKVVVESRDNQKALRTVKAQRLKWVVAATILSALALAGLGSAWYINKYRTEAALAEAIESHLVKEANENRKKVLAAYQKTLDESQTLSRRVLLLGTEKERLLDQASALETEKERLSGQVEQQKELTASVAAQIDLLKAARYGLDQKLQAQRRLFEQRAAAFKRNEEEFNGEQDMLETRVAKLQTELQGIKPPPETAREKLATVLAERSELNQEFVEKALHDLVQLAAKRTREDNEFSIPGLGRFVKSVRKARVGRNPATDERIQIPARELVKFRVAESFRDKVLTGGSARSGESGLPASLNSVEEMDARVVFELLELAAEEIKKVGEFSIPGLGRFVKSVRKARVGRNPATGERIQIPAKEFLKFQVAKSFKDLILSR